MGESKFVELEEKILSVLEIQGQCRKALIRRGYMDPDPNRKGDVAARAMKPICQLQDKVIYKKKPLAAVTFNALINDVWEKIYDMPGSEHAAFDDYLRERRSPWTLSDLADKLRQAYRDWDKYDDYDAMETNVRLKRNAWRAIPESYPFIRDDGPEPETLVEENKWSEVD